VSQQSARASPGVRENAVVLAAADRLIAVAVSRTSGSSAAAPAATAARTVVIASTRALLDGVVAQLVPILQILRNEREVDRVGPVPDRLQPTVTFQPITGARKSRAAAEFGGDERDQGELDRVDTQVPPRDLGRPAGNGTPGTNADRSSLQAARPPRSGALADRLGLA
jgi:hypothetical protein